MVLEAGGVYVVKLMFCVLTVSSVFGQRTDTIHQRVFADGVVPSYSSTIRNIGQSQHRLDIRLEPKNGTCDLIPFSGGVQVYLEGSHDGTSWFPFSPRSVRVERVMSTASSWSATSVATGAYPQIRVFARAMAANNCALYVWYTGTIPPVAFSQSMQAFSTGFFNNVTRRAVAGSSPAVITFTNEDRVAVYSMSFLNQTGAPVQISLKWSSTIACLDNLGSAFPTVYLNGLGSVVFPGSVVPYIIGEPGKALCFDWGSALDAAVGLTYRIE